MLNGRLPAEELDRRLAALSVDRTQERAKLLATAGWTQHELADRLGKSQKSIDQQMRFGRFLNLSTTVLKITEGSFRALWERTDKSDDEQSRFAEVQQLLDFESASPEAKPSRGLADKLMARFADGKWHALDNIAVRLDQPQATIEATLKMLPRSTYHAKVEQKRVGLKQHYRIFRQDRTVSLQELIEKFGPIIEELKQQGNTNAATVSIGAVKHCAHRLEQIIDEWSE